MLLFSLTNFFTPVKSKSRICAKLTHLKKSQKTVDTHGEKYYISRVSRQQQKRHTTMKETIRFTSTRKFARYIQDALDECEISYDTDPLNETLQLFAVHTTNRKDWFAAHGIELQADYSKLKLEEAA